MARAPFRVQRLRVDNRYGRRFKEYCETILGVEVIENDPYTPKQNGKIERFHKTLKREFYWRHCGFTDSLEAMNYKYRLWLSHYNTDRPHSGYGMHGLTPAQKLTRTLLHSTANIMIAYPQKVTGTLQQYRNSGFLLQLQQLGLPFGFRSRVWWWEKIINSHRYAPAQNPDNPGTAHRYATSRS